MVTLEVLNPSGAVSSSLSFAPRLPDLNEKTICMVSNMLGEADRTFPLIQELLLQRFPKVNIIPHTEFSLLGDKIDTDEIVEMVKRRGGQAAIVGNAR